MRKRSCLGLPSSSSINESMHGHRRHMLLVLAVSGTAAFIWRFSMISPPSPSVDSRLSTSTISFKALSLTKTINKTSATPSRLENELEVVKNHGNSTVAVAAKVPALFSQQKSSTSKLTPHFPIFQVGLPKSGTTTVAMAFQCSGIHTSHYCCCGSNQTHPPCFDKPKHYNIMNTTVRHPSSSMGQCVYDNLQAHRPLLEDCGSYNFYGQLDAEIGKHVIFLPQHDHLLKLHEMAPDATLLLTLRQSPNDWAKSVLSWFGLGIRFRKTFHLPVAAGISLEEKELALAQLYQNHTQRVRDFVQCYPSHRLIEVVVEDPQTPLVLAAEFGIQPSCWGWHNKGPNHKQKQTKTRKHKPRLSTKTTEMASNETSLVT